MKLLSDPIDMFTYKILNYMSDLICMRHGTAMCDSATASHNLSAGGAALLYQTDVLVSSF